MALTWFQDTLQTSRPCISKQHAKHRCLARIRIASDSGADLNKSLLGLQAVALEGSSCSAHQQVAITTKASARLGFTHTGLTAVKPGHVQHMRTPRKQIAARTKAKDWSWTWLRDALHAGPLAADKSSQPACCIWQHGCLGADHHDLHSGRKVVLLKRRCLQHTPTSE